jgi:hypothetical protein
MHTRSHLLFLAPLLLLAACKSTVSHTSPRPLLNPAYTGTFANHPYKSGRNKHYSPNTFLEVFKLDSTSSDSITIAFDSTDRLLISYTANGVPHEHIFNGTFTKKGKYKFIFQNHRKDVPPLLPILYSNHNIRYIIVSLTPEGTLFLREHWDRTGTVFIFAAGSAGNHRYYFRKTP